MLKGVLELEAPVPADYLNEYCIDYDSLQGYNKKAHSAMRKCLF